MNAFIWFNFTAFAVYICLLLAVGNAETDEESDLFEGDIKVPMEMIKDHYNFSGVPVDLLKDLFGNKNNYSENTRTKRGAGSNVRLWNNGIVRYKISAGMSSYVRKNIRTAMVIMQQETCLTFVSVNSGDYIEFVNTDTGCYSPVGRQIGRQIINLENPNCNSVGLILHEIMHAIGFWHEQSRPDRDQYVNIHNENIIPSDRSQFMKRKNTEINSLNSTYDYGSIMHYPDTAFHVKNCRKSNCKTITINNFWEYRKQGSPRLGQSTNLSSEDVKQVNRLYSCPKIPIAQLKVHVRYARNLPDTDLIWNDPDPYVRIYAAQSYSNSVTKRTNIKSGTTNPNWYQWIDFGCQRWRFMYMQIWDSDVNPDDAMSDGQLTNLIAGSYSNQRHAAHNNGYLYYDYSLVADGNDCSPNPCLNGGVCTDGCCSYTCHCSYGYTGTRCQYSTGNLRVTANYARNLPDRDGWLNDSDPYMEVIATDVFGKCTTKRTRYISGNLNPNWVQVLYFGTGAWTNIQVRVYDADNNSDDALSNRETFYLTRGTRNNIRHNCHRGFATFNYSFQ